MIFTTTGRRRRRFTAAFCVLLLLLAGSAVFLLTGSASADPPPLIGTAEDFTAALAGADDGDVLLVGDVTFDKMPAGIVRISKNVTVKSGKSGNAVFRNATFALEGTAETLAVRFEGIDFRGDAAGAAIDPAAPPSTDATLPGIMNTMCAAIFHKDVDATFAGCSFEGYHYGYGGVFNAEYSSEANRNDSLKLTLTDCAFRRNAGKFGGALYLCGYGLNITVDARHCAFEGNAAATGGAVWANNATLRFSDCTFTGHRPLADEVKNGGALCLSSSVTDLDGCLFSDNAANGEGAAIYADISPFRTLTMENCTLTGNTAENDEGIKITASDTKYDTAPRAHICFSSLVGEQDLPTDTTFFGCFFVKENAESADPCQENGYSLALSRTAANAAGLLSDDGGHLSLPHGSYPIPKGATNAALGGKFAKSLGTLGVGDNYRAEVSLTVKEAPGRTKTVVLRYGESFSPAAPERARHTFTAWEFPKGSPIDAPLFLGGDLPDGKITAKWRFPLSQNLDLILLPLLLLVFFAALFLIYKKKTAVSAAEDATESAAPLPEDWIDRVMQSEATASVSKREAEVLRKLLEGKSRKKIAEELFVTEATIRKHSTNIYAKLGVHNRTELVYKFTKQV